ncbi:AP-1 complex subunit sigma-2 [Vitis vinifera]|uniref:AP-1 complex subunit sigma-2 n=1 Tax=Vitis vinifera TaxID=29760 RepID=A0A438EHU3_VITVI|nr:AP-1 complex subunit sigma-2 [Vitis vinifera]
MEKDTTLHGTLQWARILVKSNGRKVLATIHMEVGILSFSIHLCWKNLSWVILVYPKRNCTGREVSEDVVGSPHARRNLVLNGESLETDRGYLLDLGQSLPMTRPHTGDGQWLRNGCPYEDSVGAAGLLYLSLRKFVSFSKFLGLLVDGFEKEITTSMSNSRAQWRNSDPRYASLYFCMCIDQDDNELEVLEIIHHFVEILDRYFGSVCELDLIFNFHKVCLLNPPYLYDFLIQY